MQLTVSAEVLTRHAKPGLQIEIGEFKAEIIHFIISFHFFKTLVPPELLLHSEAGLQPLGPKKHNQHLSRCRETGRKVSKFSSVKEKKIRWKSKVDPKSVNPDTKGLLVALEVHFLAKELSLTRNFMELHNVFPRSEHESPTLPRVGGCFAQRVSKFSRPGRNLGSKSNQPSQPVFPTSTFCSSLTASFSA